jgi:hypothetical protein
MLWLKLLAGALALAGLVLAAANLYGAWRWDAGTRALRERLEASRQPVRPGRFNARELDGLPAPVQRYFRAVLRDGQPMVAAVRWEPVDGTSARATLTDGANSATLVFRFDTSGLIASVRAAARGRTVQGKVVPTPWEGRWRNYEVREGTRVPTEGEVAWLLPEGAKPYWRGRISRLVYEFATHSNVART